MDNQTQPNIPPFQPQPQIQTPVPSSTNWGKVLSFILLGLVIIASSIFIGVQIGKKQIISQQPITEQPTISPTQRVVNQEVMPTTSLTTEPNPTTDWKTFSSKYGYTVEYPTNLKVVEETPSKYSALFNIPLTKSEGSETPPNVPTYYIASIPNGFENKNYEIYNFINQQTVDTFFNAKVGDIVKYDTVQQLGYGNYEKLPDITLDNQSAVVVENSKVWEVRGKDRRVFIKKNNFTYMIGTYYTTSSELENFQKFLSTLKFTQ